MATTTNYGWETPDDTDLVKDGALAQRTTANSIDSTLQTINGGTKPVGLHLIKTQSINTGVTSVTVSDAFSATYDNYKILINTVFSGQDAVFNFKLSAGTNYGYGFTSIQVSNPSVFSNGGSTSTTLGVPVGLTVGRVTGYELEVYSPFNAVTSQITSKGSFGGAYAMTGCVGTSFDYISATGFTLTATGGQTISGGTIYVYGYRK